MNKELAARTDKALAALEKMESEHARMREMLLKLEWSGHDDRDDACCPICEFTKEPPPWPIPKPEINCHAHDCELAALLEELR